MATVATTARSRTGLSRQSLRDLRVFSTWLVGSWLVSMLAWVAVPWVVLGWDPLVISSGSMSPAIRLGDIVLIEPTTHPVGLGTVIAFTEGDGVVTHRVVGVDRHGVYTTRGDANSHMDSTPVESSQVLGRGRLLVPYLGLIQVTREWWQVTGAAFGGSTVNDGNAVHTVDPLPPTGVTASCGVAGAEEVSVDISWTPSATSVITGYEVLHDAPAAGTNFTVVGITGPTVTEFTHTVPVAVLGLGTHTYAVRSVASSWTSPLSNTDAVSITEVLAVYVCSEL